MKIYTLHNAQISNVGIIIHRIFLILLLNMKYIHIGQKTQSPQNVHIDEYMYDNGDSVLPKNENSVGLVAMTLAGKSMPRRILKPKAEKIKIKKSDFVILCVCFNLDSNVLVKSLFDSFEKSVGKNTKKTPIKIAKNFVLKLNF